MTEIYFFHNEKIIQVEKLNTTILSYIIVYCNIFFTIKFFAKVMI